MTTADLNTTFQNHLKSKTEARKDVMITLPAVHVNGEQLDPPRTVRMARAENTEKIPPFYYHQTYSEDFSDDSYGLSSCSDTESERDC